MLKRLIALLMCNHLVYADIITDGSLGPEVHLQAPNYQITQELGTTVGSNLFHSFEQFNIYAGETATFSGANTIENVISRVTGGNASTINGALKNAIPNANTYLINPNGILFGPNVQLDVQGSFHATTADYLKFSDGTQFGTSTNSTFTTAPVEAFGFLDGEVAPIFLQNQGDNADPSLLSLQVPEGKHLSLIGGEIKLGDFSIDTEGIKNHKQTLNAPAGQINLIAVASKGEVLHATDVSSFTEMADIALQDNSLVTTSGVGGGKIFIRGKQLTLKTSSSIQANTSNDKDNALIDIQVNQVDVSGDSYITANTTGQGSDSLITIYATESAAFHNAGMVVAATYSTGDAGSVLIEAPNITFSKDSHIYSSSLGQGNAGNIVLRASNKLVVEGGSTIETPPYSSSTGADGGSILIEAKDIEIASGAYISSTTFSDGKGGDITILATGKMILSDTDEKGLAGGIFSASNPGLNMDDNKAGNNHGGSIYIEAEELLLEKGAMISSNTISRPRPDGSHRRSADGGNIEIQVHGTLTIDGINLHGQTYEGLGSGIYARARGENTGEYAGNIHIQAENIELTRGGVIVSTTENHAQGGNITIQADTIKILGDSRGLDRREAAAFQINYQEDFPNSNQDSESISGIYANSERSSGNAGDSGSISIYTQAITLRSGLISTTSQNAGGGNIYINVPDRLLLEKGNVTTSVYGGKGDGGNIIIEDPQFTILNQSNIIAQADAGHGGNIHIVADNFLETPYCLVSASSRVGIDGKVEIDSPDETISGDLIQLSSGLDKQEHYIKTCKAGNRAKRSRFVVKQLVGAPSNPEDLRSSSF